MVNVMNSDGETLRGARLSDDLVNRHILLKSFGDPQIEVAVEATGNYTGFANFLRRRALPLTHF